MLQAKEAKDTTQKSFSSLSPQRMNGQKLAH